MLRVERIGLITDFDGTLAPIAPTPDQAAPSSGILQALDRLARTIALVAVVSGRAVAELRDKVGLDGVTYVGNHGVEFLEAGNLTVEEGLSGYPEVISGLLNRLSSHVSLPGLIWDDKRYSAAVHYRLAEDPAVARAVLEQALASDPEAASLDVFWGKMVLEIRAPGGADKGSAVRKLVEKQRLDGAIVLGDDVTDVDALNALGELRKDRRITGVGVGVAQDDSPAELLASADYVVNGVSKSEDFLKWLAAAVVSGRRGPG